MTGVKFGDNDFQMMLDISWGIKIMESVQEKRLVYPSDFLELENRAFAPIQKIAACKPYVCHGH